MDQKSNRKTLYNGQPTTDKRIIYVQNHFHENNNKIIKMNVFLLVWCVITIDIISFSIFFWLVTLANHTTTHKPIYRN